MSLIWAAFSLTFLAVYTANLAAFMITRIQFHDLDGIHDQRIANAESQHPAFRYGTVEGGNTHEIMKRNWHHMDEYVRRHSHFRGNVRVGIDAVRNDELDAFIYDAVVLDYLAGKDANCELMTVGKWSSITGYGFGFPKNSPHVKRVNHFMLQYHHRGDLERLQNFWLTGACDRRDANAQTSSAPLGVENFLSAFFLLIGGVLLSLLCLGLEFIYCRHLRRPLQRLRFSEWGGLISMSLGKSLGFSDTVVRLRDWQARTRSMQSNSSAQADFFRLRWLPLPFLPPSRSRSSSSADQKVHYSTNRNCHNADGKEKHETVGANPIELDLDTVSSSAFRGETPSNESDSDPRANGGQPAPKNKYRTPSKGQEIRCAVRAVI